MKRQSECARHWPSALGIGPALAQREGKEIAERGDGRKTSKQPSALGVGLCKRRRGLGNKNAVRTGHRARKNTGRHSSSGSVMPYSPASRAALATVESSEAAKRRRARFNDTGGPLSKSQRGGGRTSNMSAIRVARENIT